MVRHLGESSKIGQIGPLPQAAAGGLQVQTRSQAVGALMRSAIVNKMSMKLGTLLEQRRGNLVHQLGKGATKRDLQQWKPASMFLKRAWRNSTKGNERLLGV
ncbi:hypothetical protein BHE74_00017489 [Ensete ventricosum]|nr:hypothetical protein BHE74_00017489 [Ensete ventricosum]